MFTLQQETVRMIGAKPRNSSRDLLKGTEILHLPCEYIVSFMDIAVNNQEKIHTNSATHSVNMGIKPHIQRRITNLSCIQKSAYHAGIKICNSLPNRLTSLTAEEAIFKGALRQYLYTGLFISPSRISELDCATTKTDMAERNISIDRESLQVFFLY